MMAVTTILCCNTSLHAQRIIQQVPDSLIQPLENFNEGLFNYQIKLEDSMNPLRYTIVRFGFSGKCCKYRNISGGQSSNEPLPAIHEPRPVELITSKAHVPWISLHGTINYEYYYRSRIDTPFAQNNLEQHTERFFINGLIKNKYPFRITLASRQSNSPYFQNFADVSFQFDQTSFSSASKQQLISRLKKELPVAKQLSNLESNYRRNLTEVKDLEKWLNSSGTIQSMVEEREKALRDTYKSAQSSNISQISDRMKADSTNVNIQQPTAALLNSNIKDSIQGFVDAEASRFSGRHKKQNDWLGDFKKTADSVISKQAGMKQQMDSLAAARADSIRMAGSRYTNKVTELFESRKRKLDSLQKVLVHQKKQCDSIKGVLQKNVAYYTAAIRNAKSQFTLQKIADSTGLKLDSLSKSDKRLISLRKLSLGRSVVDYSELTAQYISVTGINVEYNPRFYYALAAGKIDFRFRDFTNKRANSSGQYLLLGRIGYGDKDRKALIFSVFQGRKNQSNFIINDSVSNSISLFGYSVEGLVKWNDRTKFVAEFAKSTTPAIGSIPISKQFNTLWNFSDNSNAAYYLRGETFLEPTDTRLSGYYKNIGRNFQSFGLFSMNTNQEIWQLKLEQPLFKNRISFTGMLRKNDFQSPLVNQTIQSATLFKSAQLMIRFPKWPVVSLGYMPGSQLYFVDNQRINQSVFYIANASAMYRYQWSGISMFSSVLYSRHISESKDSGWLFSNGLTWNVIQQVTIRRLDLSGQYSFSSIPSLKYHTLDASASFNWTNRIRLGAGLKYNQSDRSEHYWGGKLMVDADFKGLGNLIVQYDRSYLPTNQALLLPVESGKVIWIKKF